MRIATLGSAVVVRAPAKVNLFLEVLARRPDGYHDIATLMLAVRLFDTLVFEVGDATSLQCDRTELTTGPDNLVMKAARLLQAKTGCQRQAKIRLVKRIPIAAGLAGGSTDAAATLAGLNQLWQLGCSSEDLANWSGEIGSDIPFFFHPPAAWCTGRGEKVAPVKLGRAIDLVLVRPPVGLSTAEVYRNVTVPEKPVAGEEICQALSEGSIEQVGMLLHNRLQNPAEKLCPVVSEWHDRLRAAGTLGTLMSGSGSSLFALCRDRNHARAVAERMLMTGAARAPGCKRRNENVAEKEQAIVCLVRSCSSQLP